MLVKEVIDIIEDFAPTTYAEDFDNVGLLVGDKNADVTGALITLDTLETVVDEAIEKKCNLIISFHPIIFSGLKKLTGKDYVEKTVIKAIKNDIAIYAIHTALDNQYKGVNDMICEKVGLKNRKILIPRKDSIKKLTTFVPNKQASAVRKALFEAGGGNIGNYDNCSFNLKGEGSFKPNEEANPVIGKRGEVHLEEETQISLIYPSIIEKKLLQALFSAHPYEEVAYEVSALDNENQHLGMGMFGELASPEDEKSFLERIKNEFNCGCIKHSQLRGKPIKKVAVLGGSGSFAISKAKAAGADIYLTADLKYHDFYKGDKDFILADIGHYESEQYTKDLLHSYLTKKISNFALILGETNTNPIKYI
ncbi:MULTISPECIES: Nif3-like dinuclear metal center hexameric protein [Salegentibacter]|jgi:dinuclear metal center YbgI/SA1388 family protein|uniref:GTP cyclohydrolase 1 type 2 homolog n=1 Tax=Salegentibacter agarivorans TaxID=345907 RepID=A0A1I2JVX5_9FLAO|nr:MULTISPECIES: Nif3-like dinuclear metal center hexameric protein [Salegentibacter]APS39070.1 NGG1p interacting factor NIF3 [Salegentibacter sp. T436]SFF58030.1 dinuclear metal center protein, YbgI/SA1388 family [Salegentibacter agarivorans]